MNTISVVKEAQYLASIPNVVAGGNHVGAGGVEGGANLVGNAEAMGGIFTIDDDKIQLQPLSDIGQVIFEHPPTGLADHITAYQNFHCRRVSKMPSSVMIQSMGSSSGVCGTWSTRCP